MLDKQAARRAVLNGRKSERIIFAVTPEMKRAVSRLAEERCMSVSAYINFMLADDVVANMESLEGVVDQ